MSKKHMGTLVSCKTLMPINAYLKTSYGVIDTSQV